MSNSPSWDSLLGLYLIHSLNLLLSNGEKKRLLLPGEKLNGIDDVMVGNFWSWAYSDLFENTVRPIFAEFIVGHALGIVDKPRIDWIPYDFEYRGKKIEVKSSGFIQSYKQNAPSKIRFDIEVRDQAWDHVASKYVDMSKRSADCYVFALHNEVEETKADILDLEQWKFYVLSTRDIETNFHQQKSVSLSRIERVTSSISFAKLKETIDLCLGLA